MVQPVSDSAFSSELGLDGLDDRPIEPEFDPANIHKKSFETSRRGYDQTEVRRYLDGVAEALRDAQNREAEMRKRLGKAVRRAEELKAAGDRPSDTDLTTQLGAEVARVIESAREAAEERTARSISDAETIISDARAEAKEIRRRAELVLDERTGEANKAARKIIDAADATSADLTAEADAVLDAAREASTEHLVEAAREGDGLVAQAESARAQILREMDRRRRTMRSQVEQLKAARDRLLESHAAVRATLDESAQELKISLVEAKVRGENASRRTREDPFLSSDQLEAEVADAATVGLIELPAVELRNELDVEKIVGVVATPPDEGALKHNEPVRLPQATPDSKPAPEAKIQPAAKPVAKAPAVAEEETPKWAPEPGTEPGAIPPMPDPAPVATPAEAKNTRPEAKTTRPEATKPATSKPAAEPATEKKIAAVDVPETSTGERDEDRSASLDARRPADRPSSQSVKLTLVQEPEASQPKANKKPANVETPEKSSSPRKDRGSKKSPSAKKASTADRPITAETKATHPTSVSTKPATATLSPVKPVVVEAAAPADQADDTGDEPNPILDSLFARMRDERPAASDDEAAMADEAAAIAEAAPEPSSEQDADEDAGGVVIAINAKAGASEASDSEGESDSAAVEESSDDALVAVRNAAISDLEPAISRRLKRVLMDEQNVLLEAVDQEYHGALVEVLPDMEHHVDLYLDAIWRQVDAARGAGAAFVDADASIGDTDRSAVAAVVQNLVVGPIRDRLASIKPGDDVQGATSAVRGFYRQHKTERLEEVASFIALRAFAGGSLDACADEVGVRWIFVDHPGGCPDGHDNELAGILARGEVFPSGNQMPPIAPGCRCALVPADR